MNENFKIVGDVELTLSKSCGGVETTKVKNLVVTTGKNWITARIMGTDDTQMTHMAIGTGSTEQTITNSTLQSEISRVLLSKSSENNYITHSATFSPGEGVGQITEAGIFNADTTGILLCRTTFSPINKDVLDTLTITWTLTTL